MPTLDLIANDGRIVIMHMETTKEIARSDALPEGDLSDFCRGFADTVEGSSRTRR